MTIVDCSTRLPTKSGPYAVLVKPHTGYHITMDNGVAWNGQQWVCDDGESTPFDDETSRVVAWVDLDAKCVLVQPPTTPPPAEEPEAYRITVTAFVAGQKIALIKTVRALTGLGLSEAKAVVEALPGKPLVIKEVSPRSEAKTIRDQLVAAGALGVQLEAA